MDAVVGERSIVNTWLGTASAFHSPNSHPSEMRGVPTALSLNKTSLVYLKHELDFHGRVQRQRIDADCRPGVAPGLAQQLLQEF